MRLSFALPALAGGLVLGWAATAAADPPPAAGAAPPAAPIFYCPTGPAKPAPGVHAAACPASPPAHVATASHHHARYHRELRVAERHVRAPREDVSASQAFIYRYERAQQGLDARAADEAWAHAGPPPCREHGCPPRHQWAEAPPPPPQVIVERAPPPPPKIIIELAPAPPPQIVFERAPAPPPQVIYDRAPPCPDRCPPARYGYEDHAAGAGYRAERYESEHAGGWRYSEQNGRGRYETWGDGGPRRRPCPPSVPVESCAASAAYASGGYASAGYATGDYESGEAEWRDGSYGRVHQYSGRDAGGYLVWPGKTGQ